MRQFCGPDCQDVAVTKGISADLSPCSTHFTEFEKQRQDALTQNERLGREVENVLNVIEDPNVAGALKQDKVQNLQWLEENYKVRKTARLQQTLRRKLNNLWADLNSSRLTKSTRSTVTATSTSLAATTARHPRTFTISECCLPTRRSRCRRTGASWLQTS